MRYRWCRRQDWTVCIKFYWWSVVSLRRCISTSGRTAPAADVVDRFIVPHRHQARRPRMNAVYNPPRPAVPPPSRPQSPGDWLCGRVIGTLVARLVVVAPTPPSTGRKFDFRSAYCCVMATGKSLTPSVTHLAVIWCLCEIWKGNGRLCKRRGTASVAAGIISPTAQDYETKIISSTMKVNK